MNDIICKLNNIFDSKTLIKIRDVCTIALEKYNKQTQMIIAIEELSELTFELCKSLRYSNFNVNNNMKTELADCIIMIEQIRQTYNINIVELQIEIYKKINRLYNRIEQYEQPIKDLKDLLNTQFGKNKKE